MNESELAAAVERLMARVDYYLHCELDDEYDHDMPETARCNLQAALWHELRASVSSIAGRPTPSDGTRAR
ncbi:MAG TPA: hypothetical protein VLJ19_05725 [Variovorax sp.]|nr:hypothetical protein [Variovorax sp.]